MSGYSLPCSPLCGFPGHRCHRQASPVPATTDAEKLWARMEHAEREAWRRCYYAAGMPEPGTVADFAWERIKTRIATA